MDKNMMYCYDAATMPMHDSHEYWTVEEVEEIAIYKVTPRIKAVMRKENSTLYPISRIDQYSWEFASCTDETEAYEMLMDYLNQCIYETLMDI